MIPKIRSIYQEANVHKKSLVSRISDIAETAAKKVEGACVAIELFVLNIFLTSLRIILRLKTDEKPPFDDIAEKVYKDFGKYFKEGNNTEILKCILRLTKAVENGVLFYDRIYDTREMANSILEKNVGNIFSCLSNKNVNEEVKTGAAVLIVKALTRKEISIENRSNIFKNLCKMLKDGENIIKNYFGEEALDTLMELDRKCNEIQNGKKSVSVIPVDRIYFNKIIDSINNKLKNNKNSNHK